MTPPRISVLIPNFNYARFLPAVVSSVLEQDCGDFELLISDDASSDDSAEVARELASRDPRIRVHLHPSNLGMVAHWNWCLEQARGAYVKFIFGDDLLVSRQALSRMADMLDVHKTAAIASTGRLLVDERGAAIGMGEDLGAEGLRPGGWVSARCLRLCRNLVGEPSVVMLRRSALDRGFDPAFRQLVDLEMWMHLLDRGDLVHCREPLCAFRCHAGQQTEVNRVTRHGDAEMIRLVARVFGDPEHPALRYLGVWARSQIVHRVVHNARKNRANANGLDVTAVQLAAGLAPWEHILGRLAYAVERPLENVVRSVRKRLGRRAARAFAAQAHGR